MNINRMVLLSNAKKNTLLIKGAITKQGAPISCSVRVHSRSSGELLSKIKSKSNGDYIILGTRLDSNYIVAIDPDDEFNIAAQDNVK